MSVSNQPQQLDLKMKQNETMNVRLNALNITANLFLFVYLEVAEATLDHQGLISQESMVRKAHYKQKKQFTSKHTIQCTINKHGKQFTTYTGNAIM